jgi:mono/diheme cytochrome c family protein
MTLAFSFRLSLVILNIVAIAAIFGVIQWRVMSMRRNPEATPANLTPFLDDDALEGRRLERVLGWALVMASIMLIALVVYFLLEPVRSDAARDDFHEDSVERGAVLFADKTSEHYEAEFSLLCAGCHGVEGTGGIATHILQPELDKCEKKANQKNPDVPECLPKSVQWQAPDLTLAALRYTRAQLIEIVTYGRPGTPMPAWGVKSGKGAKNEQSIEDLVNYIESLATTPEKAQKEAANLVESYRNCGLTIPKCEVGKDDVVTKAQKALTAAQTNLSEAQASPDTPADELAAIQEEATTAQAEYDKAVAYLADVNQLSDAAILFRLNCARCHTKGWSYYVTQPERTDIPEIPEQGSGAYGPALNGGNLLLQFPGEVGEDQQYIWVAQGAAKNELYGIRGISSGRMPHFGKVLTKEQIEAIIRYERALSGEANEESA